jgi:hypothetical protein
MQQLGWDPLVWKQLAAELQILEELQEDIYL